MKKIIWGVLIGLVLIVVIAAVVVMVYLDKIVKTGVETIGPQITGVTVRLDEIHISVLTGSAKVKGLVVGNPEGYKALNAINVGTAATGINPFSILSDKIVVRSVHIEAPEITFEGGLSGNNLSKILENVNGPPPKNPLVMTNSPAQAKAGKKIEVDDLLITGAKVHAIITDMGGKEINLTLPEIHLTDLGKNSGGLTASGLTRAILKAIINTTVKAVASEATGISSKGAELLKDNNGVNKIKKGIGGLFGK